MAGKKPIAKANLAASALAPRCKHVKLNGQNCAAPARSGTQFCMFHGPIYEGRWPSTPVHEDASTIQHEISRIIRNIETGALPTKQGALVLYGLQLASQNLTKLGAELPVGSTCASDPALDHARDPEALTAELLRRLDPLPDHFVLAHMALQRLVRETHIPYDPAIHGDRSCWPEKKPAAPDLKPGDASSELTK